MEMKPALHEQAYIAVKNEIHEQAYNAVKNEKRKDKHCSTTEIIRALRKKLPGDSSVKRRWDEKYLTHFLPRNETNADQLADDALKGCLKSIAECVVIASWTQQSAYYLWLMASIFESLDIVLGDLRKKVDSSSNKRDTETCVEAVKDLIDFFNKSVEDLKYTNRIKGIHPANKAHVTRVTNMLKAVNKCEELCGLTKSWPETEHFSSEPIVLTGASAVPMRSSRKSPAQKWIPERRG